MDHGEDLKTPVLLMALLSFALALASFGELSKWGMGVHFCPLPARLANCPLPENPSSFSVPVSASCFALTVQGLVMLAVGDLLCG